MWRIILASVAAQALGIGALLQVLPRPQEPAARLALLMAALEAAANNCRAGGGWLQYWHETGTEECRNDTLTTYRHCIL